MNPAHTERIADVLALAGIAAAEVGTYQLNHWAALVLGGAFMIAFALWIGRASARRQPKEG
ncbi:MAG TPA: hypothetical protein VKW06_00555 [Candidatus Angelobacter sp.]|nr:hypothetical protein [Candidatus Angelobacter sp.]